MRAWEQYVEDQEIFNKWRKNTKVHNGDKEESDYDMVEEDSTVWFSLPGDRGHKADRTWEGGNVGGGDEIHESHHSTNKGEYTYQEQVTYINRAAKEESFSSDESVRAREGSRKPRKRGVQVIRNRTLTEDSTESSSSK